MVLRLRPIIGGILLWTTAVLAAPAAPAAAEIKENKADVDARNAFAENILRVHRHRLKTGDVRQTSRIGGYARMPEYFNEVEYRDRATGRLLSRIRWIRDRPDTAQMLELFVHDDKGRVSVDYYVSYLTDFRNAPIYALVNVHSYDGDVHAFRQFDSSGDVLFERCEGRYLGRIVDVSLDEGEMPPSPKRVAPEIYLACFGTLPTTPGPVLDATKVVPGISARPRTEGADDGGGPGGVEGDVAELTLRLATAPLSAPLYLKRGQALFLMRRMDEAVADFSRAIELDDGLDAAYFGRGLARGRAGDLDGAIGDLDVYLERNPNSSKGFTKRGVRYIWKRDFVNAEKDLTRAVALDGKNAEALDDLGVVLAQTGRLDQAAAHFLKAKAIDPGYLKVHHNLAMVFFLSGEHGRALGAIDDALALNGGARDSLLLKGNILDALGRGADAAEIREKAEFLPDGNWSERSSLR